MIVFTFIKQRKNYNNSYFKKRKEPILVYDTIYYCKMESVNRFKALCAKTFTIYMYTIEIMIIINIIKYFLYFENYYSSSEDKWHKTCNIYIILYKKNILKKFNP